MHRAAAYNALRVITSSQSVKLDARREQGELTPLQTAGVALTPRPVETPSRGAIDDIGGGADGDGDDSDDGEGAAAAAGRRRRRRPAPPAGRGGGGRERRPPPPPRATASRRYRRRGGGVDGRGGVGGAALGARMAWNAIMVGFIVAVAVAKLEYREESADACACTSVYTRNS